MGCIGPEFKLLKIQFDRFPDVCFTILSSDSDFGQMSVIVL